ncbi:Mu-like prophage DNA circulation protein [Rhizobium sp. RU35A]|uniref:DNA circularization N-terminal domain-containing protein n=1 Tax=Rhizobium sp. RU35A TaxID=1907414 RepID=UPI0009545ED1|nr:DNA circularization N-terminal domain-containing protein [Rhizobium sp. RU35A]SIQ23790.1 Mu-like prophage DNA circulation protein [Rhizobium sp. RU35A]
MAIDDLDALPGCLPGLYRGLPFHVLDATSDHGRRVLEYLFPGVDAPGYDDFGLSASIITIEALVISDDYRLRAKAFQTVFETPGTGLLIHPWLGPINVILEEPAQIRFSSRELRMVRISARFKRVLTGLGLSSLFSGASRLVLAISSAIATATALTVAVADLVTSAVAIAAVRRTIRIVRRAADSVQSPADSAAAVPEIRTALAATTPGTPASLDAWTLGAVATIQTVTETPAVGSASQTAGASASAQALMTIGLDLAASVIAEIVDAPSPVDRVLLLAIAAHFLAASAEQAPYADYTSAQEAIAYRGRFTGLLSDLVDALEVIAVDSYQAETSDLIRAAQALSAEIVSDLNEVIGRLPAILTFRPATSLDAWQLAVHVAGDDPSRIEEVYADIVSRNRPPMPSAIDPGLIEVRELI